VTEAKRQALQARRRLHKAIAMTAVGLGAVAVAVVAYRDETKRPWNWRWSADAFEEWVRSFGSNEDVSDTPR
jgi:hypothetical protein